LKTRSSIYETAMEIDEQRLSRRGKGLKSEPQVCRARIIKLPLSKI
jgi:hypothetical protein